MVKRACPQLTTHIVRLDRCSISFTEDKKSHRNRCDISQCSVCWLQSHCVGGTVGGSHAHQWHGHHLCEEISYGPGKLITYALGLV